MVLARESLGLDASSDAMDVLGRRPKAADIASERVSMVKPSQYVITR
jgi:hypothetical protein